MTKTVMITGASSGFGAETARLFAKKQYKLILLARRLDRLEEIQKEYANVAMHLISVDVRKRESLFRALSEIPKGFNEIDVLVNSAGLALGLEPADEVDIDDWETMIDTNIKGLIYCCRQLLPMMVSRGQGQIINIGSTAGNWPYPGGNVYGATKAFVKQFSNNLRADLLEKNIRVTNIEPGLAETEFSIVRFKGDQKKADNVYTGMNPLTGQDIADIVSWVVERPAHVNVNSIEVMPSCQAWGALKVDKSS